MQNYAKKGVAVIAIEDLRYFPIVMSYPPGVVGSTPL